MLFPSPIPSATAFSHLGMSTAIDAAWISGYALALFGLLCIHPRMRRVTLGTVHMAIHPVHPKARPVILPFLFLPGMKIVLLAGVMVAIATVPPVRRAWLANVYHLHF